MSRTIRRTSFNKKKRFFTHYWEAYSEKEVNNLRYMKPWQYHSDNYYTKSCKNTKQFFKNIEDRKLRRDFKKDLSYQDIEDFCITSKKARSIKWNLH